MKHYLTTFFSLLLMGNAASANLKLSVASLESNSNSTSVELEIENTFDQEVRDARAWFFLMDSDGNVVGNEPLWIIGGDSTREGSLESGESETFTVAIDTTSEPVTAKVTFAKIVLEDGTELNRAQIASSEAN